MPLIDHRRDKLINAIIFFAKKTKRCHKTKLFKLLYFLDFMHFKETGSSVTGLDYFAWPKGPVPKDLYEEMQQPREDLRQSLTIRNLQVGDSGQDKTMITPKAKFNQKLFTAREIKLMEYLAEVYKDATADITVKVAHLKNDPWDTVYRIENRRQHIIPYEYALDSDSTVTIEEIKEKEEDEEILKKVFG